MKLIAMLQGTTIILVSMKNPALILAKIELGDIVYAAQLANNINTLIGESDANRS